VGKSLAAPESDRLYDIFRRQAEFDELVAGRWPEVRSWDASTWLEKEVLALLAELGELLGESNFRWWKRPRELGPEGRERLLEELADILHFFVSLCLKLGFGPEELYRAYVRKNEENFRRQEGRSEKPGYV